MKDWEYYQFILALARCKTLRGAAAELGVNHSTVSRKLAHLNRRADHPLFERTRGGYQVTEYGQHWLSAAQEMETIVFSANRKGRLLDNQHLAGNVSLSVSEPIAEFLLLDALRTFSESFPNISLCIDASESNVDLDRSEADVVVRSAVNPPEHLVGRRLMPYTVGYYAHKDYFDKVNPDDYKWIGPQKDSDTPGWRENSPYPNAPVHVRTIGYQMRYLALCAGMGIARAACFMADKNPHLVRLPDTQVFPTLDLWVLTHPDLRNVQVIRTVMRFLADTILDQQDLITGKLPRSTGR